MGSWFSKKSRDPPDSFDSLMETGWCDIPWSRDTLEKPKETLRALQPKHPDVEHLRILVIGPVGAGKSSFIHSIDSIFQNKIMNASYRVATDQRSFTNTFTTYTFQDESGNRLPFVIGDVMGLENEDDSGANTEDIVNALKGHIKENYTFNSVKACSVNDPGYNSNPTLNDKVHCLVFVIPIDNFANHAKERATVLMHDNLIRKMQHIRRKARDLRIRQVIILTKVDLDCHHVTEGIRNVYRSKNIHQKITLGDSTPVVMTQKTCSCVAGTALCSHIVALLYQTAQYSQLEIPVVPPVHSCTESEQQWHKPRTMGVKPGPINGHGLHQASTKAKGTDWSKGEKAWLFKKKRLLCLLH
ncbi:interferon-induced protein 44-like isoform X1 [Alosa alosa]|uniref:interferon-induced protein 44-like isoform X1 n=1 Tax=Alosa alosa TaxID=278164 RepID=UPI0020151FA0|nr:interferon-induced protein 44-like isoform X1 [Alosa alosa]